MPLPLKAGYNFSYSHFRRPPRFEMASAEAYTDFYGLTYTVSGDNICYSPKGVSTYRAGDISFIPKNVYFRSSYISDAPREEILLKFTNTMISDLLKVMHIKSFDELLNGQEMIIHLEKSEQEKILHILEEMEQEWNSYNKYSEIILKGLLNKLIIFCLSKQKNQKNTPTMDKEKRVDKLAPAIAYIKTHLAESPSLQKTAEHIHISPSYLSKIFTNRLHVSYSVFVLNEKILYAQKLLVNSDDDMSTIAKKSGFSSNAYFSDCFKRITGMSPLQFRKSYRKA